MALRTRTAGVLAVLVLFCSGCTPGGWFDHSRLDFNSDGIDTVLAGEERTNSSVTAMASRGEQTLAVLDVDTPALDGSRAAYSQDNGISWRRVLFDGKEDPGMVLYSLAAEREGQWLLLGSRNGQVLAFTSTNGFDFSLQPAPVLDNTTTRVNATVGTEHGWLVASSPNDATAGAMMLHLSPDGSSWAGLGATDAGLPALGNEFHPTSLAGGPSTMLLVGQDVYPDRPPAARAFMSNDGGKTWKDTSPDTRAVGPAGNALWTVAWSGSGFRVTGHGWPADAHPKQYPLGIGGSWTPENGWQLATDPAWSNQNQEFPRKSEVAYGTAGAIAIQKVGQPSETEPKVLLQAPGQPWMVQQMPHTAQGGLRQYSAVTAVGDGFLVAGTDSERGNDQMRLWHVDGAGSVVERSDALPDGPGSRPIGSPLPYITGFSSKAGHTRAFGVVGSQPVTWEMDGGNFRNYTAMVSDENQTLDTMGEGPGGQMLLGRQRTANGHLPVIWSRPDGGGWSVYSGNIFGAGPEDGRSPVRAVLPSSHGFIAAGEYSVDGADHAAVAISQDGRKWDHIQGKDLRGVPSAGRRITSLAESAGGTVLAGGSIDDGQQSAAAIWASADGRDFTAVPLRRAEGYTKATVVSLTAGPLVTLAVVENRSAGKPPLYSVFSANREGAVWEHASDVAAPEPTQDTSGFHLTSPLIAAHGDGFVLAATHGQSGREKLLLMGSTDGKHFSERVLDHPTLDREGLTLSALGVAGTKLLLAGITGTDKEREPFALSLDMPAG